MLKTPLDIFKEIIRDVFNRTVITVSIERGIGKKVERVGSGIHIPVCSIQSTTWGMVWM